MAVFFYLLFVRLRRGRHSSGGRGCRPLHQILDRLVKTLQIDRLGQVPVHARLGRPDYILSDAYDSSEVFVTDDQTETLILSCQGQVWVKAAGGHRSVDIYTTGLTVEEMKDLLNQLSLSSALE